MKQVLTEALTQIALAVITLLCSYAVYYIKKGTDKLKAETEKIKDDQQKQLLNTAFGRLDDIVTKAVKSLEQTTAKELRESVKDGKVDKSELKKLCDVAYKDTINTLEPEYIAVLSSTMGDLKKYIINSIETKVFDIKANSILENLMLPPESTQLLKSTFTPECGVTNTEGNDEEISIGPANNKAGNTASNT